jgi:hypothetical protein
MVRHYGTSRDYLIERLKQEGLDDLARAVTDGEISAFSVAVALGWRKRPPILGVGSSNEARRRAFRLSKLGLDDAEEPSEVDDLGHSDRP